MRRLAPLLSLLAACSAGPDAPRSTGDEHSRDDTDATEDEDDGDTPEDDTGDDPDSPDDPPAYAGRVSAPGGELKGIVGTLVGSDVEVRLVRVDENGAVVETIETTRTDANGEFRFAADPTDPTNLVVVATTADPTADPFSAPHVGYPRPPVGTAVHADPVSEFVMDTLTDLSPDGQESLEAGDLDPLIAYARDAVEVPADVITVQDAVDEIDQQIGETIDEMVDAVASGEAADRFSGTFAVHVFVTAATDTAWRVERLQFELTADGAGACAMEEVFVEQLDVEETCDVCARDRALESETGSDDIEDCTYTAYASGLVLIDVDGQQIAGALSPDGARLDLALSAGLDDQGIGIGFRQTGGVSRDVLVGDRTWIAARTVFPEGGDAMPAESARIDWSTGDAVLSAQGDVADGWALDWAAQCYDSAQDTRTCSDDSPLDTTIATDEATGGTGDVSDRGRLFWTPYFSTVGFPGATSASGGLMLLQDGSMQEGEAGWVLSAPATPGLTTTDLAGAYWVHGIGEIVDADDAFSTVTVVGTLDVEADGQATLTGTWASQRRKDDCVTPAAASRTDVQDTWTWTAADGRFTGTNVTGMRDGDGGLVFLEAAVSDDRVRRIVYVALPKAD